MKKSANEAEDAADNHAADEARRRLATGEDELVPAEFANRILAGENPVRVWREYRGLSLEELSAKAGLSIDLLEEIERGECGALPETIHRLADVLELEPSDLV